MQLLIEPVTQNNRSDVLKLNIMPGQEGYVESVAQCLDEADQRKCWRPVGIYDGKTLIGFAMYGYFRWEYPPFGRVWLDRLLINAHYQHLGYGAAALEVLIKRLFSEYRCKRIYLSVVKENIIASRLYESFGFRFNGQHDIHGEHVMELKKTDFLKTSK